jgi:hypothetical protein
MAEICAQGVAGIVLDAEALLCDIDAQPSSGTLVYARSVIVTMSRAYRLERPAQYLTPDHEYGDPAGAGFAAVIEAR